tara:strand:- start:367 stop:1410 length:1044 start_codon:yes stop_codon:yes gene_type:complete
LKKLNKKFWKNKKILVTGHTGFKGKWLCALLSELSSNVYGISNKNKLNLKRVKNFKSNLNDNKKLKKIIKNIKPEIIFHLAAQPIVSISYEKPAQTYNDNVFGLINLLEALKTQKYLKAIVIVTSDKCYKIKKFSNILTENSPLGGNDPYSASKACAEIISNSYYKSYFSFNKIGVATARAGNVIGGNDFSKDRIIPDLYFSKKRDKDVFIRNPKSTRPWQNVIDVVYGYCLLAENLYKKPEIFSGAWNFAKQIKKEINVLQLAKIFLQELGFDKKIKFYKGKFHEEKKYILSSKKSQKHLGWKPIFDKKKMIIETANWYYNYLFEEKDALRLLSKYVKKYLKVIYS